MVNAVNSQASARARTHGSFLDAGRARRAGANGEASAQRTDGARGKKARRRRRKNRIIGNFMQQLFGAIKQMTGGKADPAAGCGTPGGDTTIKCGTKTPGGAANAAAGMEDFGRYQPIADKLGSLHGTMNSMMDDLAKLDPKSDSYQKDMFLLQTKIQQAQQGITMLTQLLSNLLRAQGEAELNVARNIRA